MSGEMTPLQRELEDIFNQLGLPPLSVLEELAGRWDELAGPPWEGVSFPLVIRHGELTVQSREAALVRVLAFSANQLQARLERHFGPGVVRSVKVAAPPRRTSSLNDKNPGQTGFSSAPKSASAADGKPWVNRGTRLE